ncbi:MAG: hypothetical protein M5R36_06920 [Deltaproteobacteria bacterium]|nr:hypothetical protein [Deltaproteobacteria bacterium]
MDFVGEVFPTAEKIDFDADVVGRRTEFFLDALVGADLLHGFGQNFRKRARLRTHEDRIAAVQKERDPDLRFADGRDDGEVDDGAGILRAPRSAWARAYRSLSVSEIR